MPPSGFSIGPLFIHFYGILIMLGALAAAWLSTVEAKRRGQDPEVVWDALAWVLIAGIIGARIWHILTPPPSMVAMGITTHYYLTHPLDAIAIWNGGLGIPGAVMGGALALYLYARRHKLNFATWTDIIAPGLALAQAIGRWGNFFNQEVYGAPTNLPWAIYIDPAHRLPGFENIAYYHPLFLYESLWNLANMALLLWMGRRFKDRLLPGDIFLSYLVVYPVGRFLLEFLRLDASRVAGINANQTLMAVIFVLAGIALFLRHRSQQAPQVTTPAADSASPMQEKQAPQE
jgi:phosphatidylglycerol:prolipoprotein diacylglycerol transferase